MLTDIPRHMVSLMGFTEPECPPLSVYVALDSRAELWGTTWTRGHSPPPQLPASMLQAQGLLVSGFADLSCQHHQLDLSAS